ncbi:MAG: electron transfer flavoprotein subunit alpha/FixB family protein, partial [Fimbriimonadaceae bacterium]|nr:electron transfer flavoprotein subunit alpha/FixB family protein [Fimbriimonadaceae bacterium]
VMPRVAVLLDAGMVTDAIAVMDAKTFQRPIVAGSVIATVAVETERVVLTVRTSAFGPAAPTGSANTRSVALDCPTVVTRTSAESQASGGRPDLTQAKVVVSGGRPLKDAGTFEKLIGGLADALGGGVGATRAAVDSGIAPNEAQVGQTGKIVAPELYIAAGVSGSTQHLAGMKDSKCIVAINTDGDAPIFEVADFGLVEDLYTAIPALMERLRQ